MQALRGFPTRTAQENSGRNCAFALGPWRKHAANLRGTGFTHMQFGPVRCAL